MTTCAEMLLRLPRWGVQNGGSKLKDEFGEDEECPENWHKTRVFQRRKRLCESWNLLWIVSTKKQQPDSLGLKDLNSKFGFLLDIKTLLNSEDLDVIHQNCLDFGNFDDTNVDGRELCTEIWDCKMLLDTNRNAILSSPLDLLSFIVSYSDDVFPNLRIALQILLTISVSIASCEHSFSKLKLILSYLWALMGQDRSHNLALLRAQCREGNTRNNWLWWCHWSIFSS